MLLGTAALWSACSDTWDDHYDSVEGGMADQPSILENMQSDESMANFLKVVEAIGASNQLSNPQQLTVWVPMSLTSAQADSIIALYEEEVAAGKDDDDNKAFTQFFNNHAALYTRTISSLTNDTISMLNGKYMQLIGTSSSTGTLEGVPFSDPVLCNNGIIYKTDEVLTFFPNIREYIELQTGMDSIANLIVSYDEYELDENSSVAGGVVDGKTVYLDSVTYLNNELLQKYGYIQREDSTYRFIVPTDEVWYDEYAKYSQYFQYDTSVNNADSLSDALTKQSIVRGRFFNMSSSQKYNMHPEDSICNTQYNNTQSHNPRQNVYYKPESGILAGLEKVECSNGYVYVDNTGVIDPATTFFTRSDIEAYSGRYYEVPTNSSGEETMNVAQGTYEYTDSTDSTRTKTYYYMEVTAKTSSAQTSLEYTIPDTYSNCYYNIYVVTVPGTLPLWFQVQQNVVRQNGTFASSGTYFTNPHPVTEGSCDNSDIILRQSNNGRCFVASTEKVDTILVQSAVNYTYSGQGLDDGVVELTIGSFGPSSASYRERIYTRTLRLNEIIMVPFETEDEALEAADDLDAFNDEILEANKEN